jgi:hypothetical protein
MAYVTPIAENSYFHAQLLQFEIYENAENG